MGASRFGARGKANCLAASSGFDSNVRRSVNSLADIQGLGECRGTLAGQVLDGKASNLDG